MFKKRVKASNSAPRSSAQLLASRGIQCSGERQGVNQNKPGHVSLAADTSPSSGTSMTVEELESRFDPQRINQNKNLSKENLIDTDDQWEMEQLRKSNLSIDRLPGNDDTLAIDRIKQRVQDRINELKQELNSLKS